MIYVHELSFKKKTQIYFSSWKHKVLVKSQYMLLNINVYEFWV